MVSSKAFYLELEIGLSSKELWKELQSVGKTPPMKALLKVSASLLSMELASFESLDKLSMVEVSKVSLSRDCLALKMEAL